MIAIVWGAFNSTSVGSPITFYVGDPCGFDNDIYGLPSTLINFDNLTAGDIINDQNNPPVRFLTNEGYNIVADTNAWGTDARSEDLCARVPKDSAGVDFGDLDFSEPVIGASIWVLDVSSLYQGIDVTVTVFGENDVVLDSCRVGAGEGLPEGVLHTYVGVPSDEKEITRIRVQNE